MNNMLSRWGSFLVRAAAFAGLLLGQSATGAEPISVGDRRELFVDRFLVEELRGARLQLHEPRDEGIVLKFDQPWEGQFSGYCTLIQEGDRYRVYYRGKALASPDGQDEQTCVAESTDGIHWTRPQLGLHDFQGSKANNIVLGNVRDLAHNFSPVLDTNPAAPAAQRYKALAGVDRTGLVAFVSADGLKWTKLRDEPVLTKAQVPFPYMFDSQNLAFWSPGERKYLMYFRVFHEKIRRIVRAESDDFVHWTNLQLMQYRLADGSPAPVEHLYTNQTSSYFRAPHISLATAARFFPGRQVLSTEEAEAIGVNPQYFRDTSDAILMSTRGGDVYDRTFMTAFIRPGIGARNWVSRTNYPALNIVPTGPHEMSIYVNQDYAQPTAHLHRYSLRWDGFASVRADRPGGELRTKPLLFTGKRLVINFATSAAGSVRFELQSADGQPLPGYTLEDSVPLIGNEIERTVKWKGGDNVAPWAGKPVRLRVVLEDADLFSLRFTGT